MYLVQNTLFILCIVLSALEGQAQDYKNIHLLDRWHKDSLITNTSKVRYNGCWGFVRNGIEYAIAGSTEGAHFFRLNDNNQLIDAGFVEGRFNSSLVVHREFRVYGNYAYSICDEGNSSLQIIDLSFLPDSVVKVADLQDERFGKIHNLFIDTTNALLYACLVTPFPGGNPTGIVPMRVFSLANPTDPQLLWQGPSDIPEVHDCYVRDNLAILNCGMEGLRVYDFTNPLAPVYKSNLTFYQDQGYNHQGWLSPDGKTYVFADETNGKRVKRCAVSSDYTITINALFGVEWESGSVPHNIMITNELAFVAYYNEGLRIFDLRHPIPKEIAFFDTYPETNTFKMNGAWGVFAAYPSGRIIVSDRQYGLHLFQFDRDLFLDQPGQNNFSLYPNPTSSTTASLIRSSNDEISNFSIVIIDPTGKEVYREDVKNKSYCKLPSIIGQGLYYIRINFMNYLGEEERETLQWIKL
jgi:choice-of-anchor B domain-containing protein